MRKLIPLLIVVFALALGLGALAPAPVEAGSCFYTCGCNGQVLYCCGSSCKVATWPTPIQCPQVSNC